MFLFWTIGRLVALLNPRYTADTPPILPSLIGSTCYLFCDTAWFSAVESEVYSLSMLFSSAILWTMVRWATSPTPFQSQRWLFLTVFLVCLSTGVHLLSLLTLPAILLIYIFRRHRTSAYAFPLRQLPILFILVIVGLSPWLIIPLRAAADPPINSGDPSSASAFHQYVSRAQYEHAPIVYGRCFNSPIVAYTDGKPVYAKEMDMIFPRMWKQHPHAEQYYTDWCGRHGKNITIGGHQYYKPSFVDNLVIFFGYQLGYMNLRYLMWNFSGRYDDNQGFGNLQRGQFISGIPFLDRLLVGTGKGMPESLANKGHNRYFLLPFALGIVGFFSSRRERPLFWMLLALFITSNLLLTVYLNHPVYEPRERDYAYILSFYTFAIYIGLGTDKASHWFVSSRRRRQGAVKSPLRLVLLAVPLLMACQNWDDHDRSCRYIARDSAANLLQSCSKGAILFTLGDNDTFPLWYMQHVEEFRTDVQVINISLLADDSYLRTTLRKLQDTSLAADDLVNYGPYQRMMSIIRSSVRPVHFSHYAKGDPRINFPDRLKLCGISYLLSDSASVDTVDIGRCQRLFAQELQWHPVDKVYIDEISNRFLLQYWKDALLTVENLAHHGRASEGLALLDHIQQKVPLSVLKNPETEYRALNAYSICGDRHTASMLAKRLEKTLREQMEYYGSMPGYMLQYIEYTIDPLLKLEKQLDSTIAEIETYNRHTPTHHTATSL